MKKIIFGAVAIFIFIVGAWSVYFYSIHNLKPETTVIIDKVATSTIASYKDATYIIDGEPIILVNGVAEKEIVSSSASRQITKYFGNEATGDLNGDGQTDVAFLLMQDNGGSGTFFYVAAALKTDSGYKGTNAIFLGDRIAPQSTQIQGDELIVNYADRNPGESFSVQPSLGVSKYLKIIDGKLIEVK